MMRDQRALTLREAGVTLFDCDHRTPKQTTVGLPYVTIPQMVGGEIDLRSARKISESDYADWTRKTKPEPGDVVLSRRCNPGETAFVREGQKFALGQNLVLLRSDNIQLRSGYLRWLARSPAWWSEVERYRNPGAVFDSLKCSDIVKFTFSIPEISEQDSVVEILDALNDKMELNRQIARALEDTAQALFKSWFVDFDFVRTETKDISRNFPGNITACLPKNVGNDGLPIGWREGSVAELAQINPITPLPSTSAAYVDMAALPTTGSLIQKVARRPPGSGARFRNGDTLIARITPCLENGKTALVDCLEEGEVAWGSTEFIVLRPGNGRPHALPYLLARHQPFRDTLIAAMSGTSGRQRVQADAVLRWPMVIPPSAVLCAFGAAVDPMFASITQLGRQNRTLAALCDTLIPKLISGELRIRDVEQAMAVA